jgi:hypothetical protein
MDPGQGNALDLFLLGSHHRILALLAYRIRAKNSRGQTGPASATIGVGRCANSRLSQRRATIYLTKRIRLFGAVDRLPLRTSNRLVSVFPDLSIGAVHWDRK